MSSFTEIHPFSSFALPDADGRTDAALCVPTTYCGREEAVRYWAIGKCAVQTAAPVMFARKGRVLLSKKANTL